MIWKIQVVESMPDGLCRQKLLQQKWLAYKSSLVSIEILASTRSDAGQGRAPRETTEKTFSTIGVDFDPESGMDLEWIFGGREKRAEKIRADFVTEFVTTFVPPKKKGTGFVT